MLLNKSNNLFPINDNDNQPINVIKITDMIISIQEYYMANSDLD